MVSRDELIERDLLYCWKVITYTTCVHQYQTATPGCISHVIYMHHNHGTVLGIVLFCTVMFWLLLSLCVHVLWLPPSCIFKNLVSCAVDVPSLLCSWKFSPDLHVKQQSSVHHTHTNCCSITALPWGLSLSSPSSTSFLTLTRTQPFTVYFTWWENSLIFYLSTLVQQWALVWSGVCRSGYPRLCKWKWMSSMSHCWYPRLRPRSAEIRK